MIRIIQLLYCHEKQIWKEQTVVNVKALFNRVRVKLIEKYKCFFRQDLDWDSGTQLNTGNNSRSYSKIKVYLLMKIAIY